MYFWTCKYWGGGVQNLLVPQQSRKLVVHVHLISYWIALSPAELQDWERIIRDSRVQTTHRSGSELNSVYLRLPFMRGHVKKRGQ